MGGLAKARLGQLLRDAGELSPENLRKALSAQLICGGKIGTSLIELEMVPIDEVSRHLATQLNLPEATPALLDQTSQAVLDLVPRDLCARYKVVPLKLEGRQLKVVMLDPMNLAQIDELSFVTGLQVQPVVTPELRLYYLLERYFGVERPSRYLRVPEDEPLPLDTGGPRPQRRRYLEPLELPPLEPMGSSLELEVDDDDDDLQIDVDLDLEPARGVAPEEPPPDDEDLGLMYLDSFTDLPVIEDAPAPLEQALAAMDRARSQQDVARCLVQPVVAGTSLTVLFMVRGKALVGVAAQGTDAAARVGELVVSLTPRSLLRECFERRVVVRGPGQDPFVNLVAGYLEAPAPVEACVAPVFAGQQVAQLLCTLSGQSPLDGGAAEALGQLCARATQRHARLVSDLSR